MIACQGLKRYVLPSQLLLDKQHSSVYILLTLFMSWASLTPRKYDLLSLHTHLLADPHKVWQPFSCPRWQSQRALKCRRMWDLQVSIYCIQDCKKRGVYKHQEEIKRKKKVQCLFHPRRRSFQKEQKCITRFVDCFQNLRSE